ncbi:cysteine-rich RECEPTOR-like kinase [Rhynchospora pubera]|uniref:Cysteine-rich RECEPTOR-like kinase n=1 Tax=Rhynchospora pubera TaxID=906938 RepID=A0AAV8G8U6_9POAL|nr:cysteine-rich RECEPTOR-like kinase [Rhynchospora pubera]
MHFPLSIILCLLLYLSVPALSDSNPLLNKFCGGTTNFSDNSTYQSNINQLFSSLITNSTSNGFAAGSVGTVPNLVSGLVLCRGDANSSFCSSCLSKALENALQLCPYDRAATIYYDYCLLKFSNQQFLSSTDNPVQIALISAANVTSNPARFDQIVADLISNASAWASYNSTRRFAIAEATNFSQQYPVIYGLVQCTADLTGSECQSCLQTLIDEKPLYFQGREGGRLMGVRCNFRYEVYTFYSGQPTVKLDATAVAVPPAPLLEPTGSSGKKTRTTVIAIAVAIPAFIVCLSAIIFGFCVWKNKRPFRKVLVKYNFDSEDVEGVDSFLLDLSTLKTATSNFNESNKLGEGGFGAVYKGTLPNGQDIAVKRLSQSSGQGLGELKNELVLLAKLQHKNLVRVLGVCLEEQEKLLVYEFLPNRSLDKFLFNPENKAELNWRKRSTIINGVARGLQYLHEDSQLIIIHRDLKASNILLDGNMTPKISDFGLARLFSVDQTVDVTKRVVGTFGYMAPEYAMHGLYSIKSDVFCFGILLLEIITGKRNSGFWESNEAEDLLSFAWENWTAGTVPQLADPTLRHCPSNEIVRCVHIALLCVQDNPTDRPKMSEVVIMLSSNTMSLKSPFRPSFCITNTGSESNLYLQVNHNQGSGSSQPSDMSGHVSQNQVSITELDAR